jgi:hypothetical protein
VNSNDITSGGSMHQRAQGALHHLVGFSNLIGVEHPAVASRHTLGECRTQRGAL